MGKKKGGKKGAGAQSGAEGQPQPKPAPIDQPRPPMTQPLAPMAEPRAPMAQPRAPMTQPQAGHVLPGPPPGFQTPQQPTGAPPGFAAQSGLSFADRMRGQQVHPAAQPLPQQVPPQQLELPAPIDPRPQPVEQPQARAAQTRFSTTDLTKALVEVVMEPRKPAFNFKLPTRPGFGTKGRPIRLISNHFEVIIPQTSVFHYDVEIEQLKRLNPGEVVSKDELKTKAKPQQVSGRRVPARVSRDVINRLKEKYKSEFSRYVLAYDGNKNLYTKKPLPFNEPRNFVIEFKEDGRDIESRFKVSIKPVEKEGTNDCEVSLAPLHDFFKRKRSSTDMPQEAITALDIILRSGPSDKMFPVRSSFFNIPRNPRDKSIITGGHEIWFGYYQSLRPGQWKPLIVVDKSATTFYPAGPVLNFFVQYLGKRGPEDLFRLRPDELTKLNKEMKTVQVVVKHLPYARKYRVLKVTNQRANEKTFIEEKNVGGKVVKRKVTIEQYFRDNYKPLRFPQLPCLQVGNPNKDICLPVEVCDLVQGQHYRRKLTPQQTSEMIRFTATTPRERFQTIQQSIQNLSDMSQSALREFGIQINPKPLQVEGRVLDAPKVLYDQAKTIQPRDGAWDMRSHRFFKGSKISCWAILSLADDRFVRADLIQKMASMLMQIGGEMGMTIPPVTNIFYKGKVAEQLGMLNVLEGVKKQVAGIQLLVIILGRNSDYKEIKMIADTKLGLMTQCLKDDSVVKKCNPQLIGNVLQKINAKMGGVNSSLNRPDKPAIFSHPVIIIGADVSHPGPGEKVMPSVAAAVGSLDSYPSRYACAVEVQRNDFQLMNRVEQIVNLDKMVKKLLKAFYTATTHKPSKIIFFRDGVSEGQFADVQEHEIKLIRKACEELQPGYKPSLTFIVVQKRHHTRFMPENERDGVGRCKNVPPGTLVDQQVTTPADFDYFLCSHTGIQGTSRPAHYTVIWDENNFTADELHKLTYHLCHTYVRCTRSISIPAPVQYAHLAAFRASYHAECNITSPSGSEGSIRSDDPRETPLPQEIIQSIVTQPTLGSMYYV